MKPTAIPLLILPLCLILAACSHGTAQESSAGHPPAAGAGAGAGADEATEALGSPVKLDVEQAAKLGLKVEAARAAQFRAEVQGYGQAWSHEPIAQAVAELSAAEAASQQSRAALERIQKLGSTAGAYAADALEVAQRQAATDTAAWLLAQRKLTALLGARLPAGVTLAELASGKTRLVRITFPIGSPLRGTPGSVRLLPLDANEGDKGWSAMRLWEAPADAAVPGRSLWAALPGEGPAEGDRLDARAPDGPARAGILVPDAAVVVSDDHYWCFIEKPAGTYTRVAIDVDRPVASGYVVTQGVAAGDRLVTGSAGLLLARMMSAGGSGE